MAGLYTMSHHIITLYGYGHARAARVRTWRLAGAPRGGHSDGKAVSKPIELYAKWTDPHKYADSPREPLHKRADASITMSSALVIYEPPALTPLTTPLRHFQLPHSGSITMQQHWAENGTRTGGAVWDAGQVLGHYVDQQCARWQRHSCLELGSGLGYVSIVASRCGFSHVMATDGDVGLIEFARANARSNAGDNSPVRVEHFEWGDEARLAALIPAGALLPDVILAADVVYLGSASVWGAFLQTVASLCRRRRLRVASFSTSSAADAPPIMRLHDGSQLSDGDPVVLISHTRRYAAEEEHFFVAARRQRFRVTALPESTLHATFQRGRSVLFELQWRGEEPAEAE